LPPKDEEHPDEKVFPFLCFRLLEGEDTISEGKVTVVIYIGCKSEDVCGWEDLVSIAMKIRQQLEEHPTILQRFVLQYPFKFTIYEEQPWPFWMAAITTQWSYAKPVMLEGAEAWGGDLIWEKQENMKI